MNKILPNLPIAEDEKDTLMELVEEMANEEFSYKHSYEKFHRLIQKLQMKYGEIAYLTAMKADFLDTENPVEQIELYKKSIQLAGNPLDIAVITQSTGSIAEIYIEELSDYDNGLYWLAKYKESISKYGDAYTIVCPSDLEPKLRRLNIRATK